MLYKKPTTINWDLWVKLLSCVNSLPQKLKPREKTCSFKLAVTKIERLPQKNLVNPFSSLGRPQQMASAGQQSHTTSPRAWNSRVRRHRSTNHRTLPPIRRKLRTKRSSWHPWFLGKELDHCCRRAVSYTQDLSFVTGHYKAGGLVPAVTDAPGSGRSLCQARSLSPPEQRPRAAAPCPVTECPAPVALRPCCRSQLRTDPGYWCQGLRQRSERGPLCESLRQFTLLRGSDQRTASGTCEITYKGRRS